MKKKISKNLVITSGVFALMLSASIVSQAGQWIKEDRGWRYQFEDGTFAAGKKREYFIDDNKDNIWENYFFDDDGYLLTNHKEHISGFDTFRGKYSYDNYYDSDGRLYNKKTGEIYTKDVRKEVAFMQERADTENATYTRVGEGKIKPEILELLYRTEDYVKNHYVGTIETIVERGQRGAESVSNSSITYSNGVEFQFWNGYLTHVKVKDPSTLFVGVEAGDSLQKVVEILGEPLVYDSGISPKVPVDYSWAIKEPDPSLILGYYPLILVHYDVIRDYRISFSDSMVNPNY